MVLLSGLFALAAKGANVLFIYIAYYWGPVEGTVRTHSSRPQSPPSSTSSTTGGTSLTTNSSAVQISRGILAQHKDIDIDIRHGSAYPEKKWFVKLLICTELDKT